MKALNMQPRTKHTGPLRGGIGGTALTPARIKELNRIKHQQLKAEKERLSWEKFLRETQGSTMQEFMQKRRAKK